MKTLEIFTRALKTPGLSILLTLFGLLGWILLVEIMTPSSLIEDMKDYLRQRDDQRHGEIWDLHFCEDSDHGDFKAEISYPESTIVMRRPISLPDGIIQWDSTIEYMPGRGTIMNGAYGEKYSPPGNTVGSLRVENYCSGRIEARGFFPDSLKIQYPNKFGEISIHWITGIKLIAPKKIKAPNRTRITIIHKDSNLFKVIVTERPRIDLYSCTDYGDYCERETWWRLFWKAFAS